MFFFHPPSLVRLGSCRDLREGGRDACQCKLPLKTCSSCNAPATPLSSTNLHSLTEDNFSTCTVKIPGETRSVSPRPRRKGCKILGNSQPSASQDPAIAGKSAIDENGGVLVAHELRIEPLRTIEVDADESMPNESNCLASISLNDRTKLVSYHF